MNDLLPEHQCTPAAISAERPLLTTELFVIPLDSTYVVYAPLRSSVGRIEANEVLPK